MVVVEDGFVRLMVVGEKWRKTRREDEDEREGSAKKSIMPLHFNGNY